MTLEHRDRVRDGVGHLEVERGRLQRLSIAPQDPGGGVLGLRLGTVGQGEEAEEDSISIDHRGGLRQASSRCMRSPIG